MKFNSKELKVLNEIAEDLVGTSYEDLLKYDPEEAGSIYCYAEENGLF